VPFRLTVESVVLPLACVPLSVVMLVIDGATVVVSMV